MIGCVKFHAGVYQLTGLKM